MTLPRNVLRFQMMLYLSLTLDALSVAFQDRTPTAAMTPGSIMFISILDGCLILFMVFLVSLAAQRRKNWPRWVLGAALLLSVISLINLIGQSGLRLDSAVEVVSCGLTAAGLYYSCTGDARGWFNA